MFKRTYAIIKVFYSFDFLNYFNILASHKRKSALEEIMKEEGEAMRNKRDLKKFWLNK